MAQPHINFDNEAQPLERNRSLQRGPAMMPEPVGQEGGDTAGPVQQWRVIRRHKGTIILVAAIGALAGFLITLPQTPVYQAHSTLEVQEIANDFLNKVKQLNPTADSSGYFGLSDIQTQVKILQSETLLERVFNKLHGDNPQPKAEPAEAVSGWKKALNLPGSQPGATALKGSNFKVRATTGTRIIEVQYDSSNPAYAAQFLNTLTSEYIDSNIEARWKANQRTSEWLTKQLDDVRIKLEHSDDAVQEYVRRAGLMFTGGGDKESVSSEKLRQSQGSLSLAQAERASAQSRLEMAKSSPIDALPEVINDAGLKSLVDKLLELRRQEADLLIVLTPKHEKVLRLQAQIGPLEAAFQKERAAILGRIQAEFNAAQNKERLIASEYAAQFRVVTNDSEKAVQYGMLKREADSNRALYDDMLQKVKAAGVASAVQASNIRVLDPAKVPGRPYKPDFQQNCIIGLLAGLVLGVGLVIVRDRADRTIQEPGDIQYWINLPELGVIPSAAAENSRRIYAARGATGADDSQIGQTGRGGRGSVELMTWNEKPSQVAEAFRSVLTSILFTGEGGNRPRILVMTSGLPSEGKTTSATNLAIALAEVHRKVLLVDADLRKPRMHHLFGAPNDKGLSNLLEDHDLNDAKLLASVHSTAIPDLFVLPSGPATHAAANLLYSTNLPVLLEMFRKQYDMVIIDTPPMLAMTDARVVGSLADGVILVMRSRKTTRDAALAMRQRFAEDQTRVLGTILNDWNPKNSPGGYYGNYGYGYNNYSYYGKGEDEPQAAGRRKIKTSLKRTVNRSAAKVRAIEPEEDLDLPLPPVQLRREDFPAEPARRAAVPEPQDPEPQVLEPSAPEPHAPPSNLRVIPVAAPRPVFRQAHALIPKPKPALSWVGLQKPVSAAAPPKPRPMTPVSVSSVPRQAGVTSGRNISQVLKYEVTKTRTQTHK